MAIELSKQGWKLGSPLDFGQRPRLRNLATRDLEALAEEIRLAKVRFGLPEETPAMGVGVRREPRHHKGSWIIVTSSI